MRRAFTGCGTALVTPFKSDGSLDEAGVSRLARRQIDLGIHFLVPCGTTGEVPTLTDAEQVKVVELVVAEARGRVPVLAGAGGYNTQEVIHAARRLKAAGADGILSVTPYYNKPTPEGLFQHYRAIAEAIEIPIIIYNVPGRTGCNVDPATLIRLSSVPHIAGVKEASGNVTQMCEICAGVPDDFAGRLGFHVVFVHEPAEAAAVFEALSQGLGAGLEQFGPGGGSADDVHAFFDEAAPIHDAVKKRLHEGAATLQISPQQNSMERTSRPAVRISAANDSRVYSVKWPG